MGDIYLVTDEDRIEGIEGPLAVYSQRATGGIDRLSAQATELLGAAGGIEINDSATLDQGAALLKEVKRLEKDFDEARKAAVDPLNNVVKEINSAAKEVFDERGKTGKLNDAEDALKKKIGAYMEAREAKVKGVHTAKRFTYTLIDRALLKIEYLTPDARAIQAVVTAMGKLAEKATARNKAKRAIEVHEETDIRARAG